MSYLIPLQSEISYQPISFGLFVIFAHVESEMPVLVNFDCANL